MRQSLQGVCPSSRSSAAAARRSAGHGAAPAPRGKMGVRDPRTAGPTPWALVGQPDPREPLHSQRSVPSERGRPACLPGESVTPGQVGRRDVSWFDQFAIWDCQHRPSRSLPCGLSATCPRRGQVPGGPVLPPLPLTGRVFGVARLVVVQPVDDFAEDPLARAHAEPEVTLVPRTLPVARPSDESRRLIPSFTCCLAEWTTAVSREPRRPVTVPR